MGVSVRRGGRVRSAAVAGAVLAVLAGPRAWAADADSVPSYAPAPDSLRIEGARSTGDAEELKAGGFYSDTIGPGERLHYRVRLDAAETSAFVSAVAQPVAKAKVAYGDGIAVTLMTAAGSLCGSGSGSTFGTEQARPLADFASRLIGEDRPCQEAGTYYVRVERTSDPASDRSDWPLELAFMREPGLKGGPKPTAAPSGWPSASPEPAGAEPVDRKGGTGFNDARSVEAGVWRDRLVPGQTAYYRVPLDWGQQLTARAELSQADELTDDSAYASSGLTVEILDTVRGPVLDGSKSYDGEQAELGLGPTAPVAYNNRFESSAGVAGMRFSGWYYVAVTLDKEIAGFTKGRIPLLLRLNVEGEPGEGPGYDGDASAAGFGISDEDREAAVSGATAEESAASGAMTVLGLGGIGAGTVLLGGLGAWTLIARRRAAAGAGQGPGPVPGQGYGPPAW
ncbi:hypothetical protein [Streptomyces sp. NPDC060194]|uniref:hypothetical protein n=1 Tax=Streptomyces sp. NPDC060194 TaxID=3347069 RepID=UPI003651D706